MSQLVEMVAGGYRIMSTKKVIPAHQLISFGSSHEFPDGIDIRCNVNLEKEGANSLNQDIFRKAGEYADKMQAPYFQLDWQNQVHPGGLTGCSLKKAKVVNSARIQLYVINRQTQ
tara:strand:- start:304 stop:648 length:345 start_codon:yes stop_codon:yes gene_type:complete